MNERTTTEHTLGPDAAAAFARAAVAETLAQGRAAQVTRYGLAPDKAGLDAAWARVRSVARSDAESIDAWVLRALQETRPAPTCEQCAGPMRRESLPGGSWRVVCHPCGWSFLPASG